MSCNSLNFSHYIKNVNNNCGESMPVMMGSCEVICMMDIVVLLNECLNYLVTMNLNTELENIVEFCYNKNHPDH